MSTLGAQLCLGLLLGMGAEGSCMVVPIPMVGRDQLPVTFSCVDRSLRILLGVTCWFRRVERAGHCVCKEVLPEPRVPPIVGTFASVKSQEHLGH